MYIFFNKVDFLRLSSKHPETDLTLYTLLMLYNTWGQIPCGHKNKQHF